MPYLTSNAMKSSTEAAASRARSVHSEESCDHWPFASFPETLVSNFFFNTGMPSARLWR